MSDPIYEEIKNVASSDPLAAVEKLVARLIERKQFHQAFDARLMAIRLRLGLPVIWQGKLEDLDESRRDRIESAYVDACREIGDLLLAEGHPRDAWYYLRHVPERHEVAQQFAEATTDDESREEFIEIAVHEGLCPQRGFAEVIEHYGICNAITLFDSAMPSQPRKVRQLVAPLLIAELHAALRENLSAEIARQEGKRPQEHTIVEMIAERDWLFGEHAYHVDTSHLNAVVRFARELDDATPLGLAFDLAEYGKRLGSQFQFASEEPFTDTYPAHAIFFRGLLAAVDGPSSAEIGGLQDWQQAEAYFRQKAEELPYSDHGAGPAEVYIAFLARTGYAARALAAAAKYLPAGAVTSGFAPTLAELAASSGDYQQLARIGKSREDLVTFVTGVLAQSRETA